MVGVRETTAFHRNVDEQGRVLSASDRERLIAPYLPKEPQSQSKKQRKASAGSSPVRNVIGGAINVLVFTLIQLIFSIYIRLRSTIRNVYAKVRGVMYYHHRTPELIQRDVNHLQKVPRHLSIILELQEHNQKGAALETLVNDVCECAAWTACAGIPLLSIYEKTGVLKTSIPQLHRHISKTMASYFGDDNPSKPTISLRAPHMPSFSPPASSPGSSPDPSTSGRPHLTILLLSASDGRRTLVDLTKTLAEMSQKAKLAPEDISPDLIDAEICESIMDEPDLLILFGDSIVLQGFPPWQIRLTEIFHVPDNHDVDYQVFLQGLHRYAGAQMRFGS